MSDDDEQPLDPALIEVLERMREKGDLAFDATFLAYRHMSNIGFMLIEAETSFKLGTEPDETVGLELRLEQRRQIEAQMVALRHLCEAAAMVPELRRRYETHGHKEVPFGYFLTYVSNWADMRKAEVLTIKHI